jgi:hypothetical protein
MKILQIIIMMILLNLISLCAIGIVVIVGIFDDTNEKPNNEINDDNIFEIDNDPIMNIYVKMKNIQAKYNETYNKFPNNLEIKEKEYYYNDSSNKRSLPIPIPYAKKK